MRQVTEVPALPAAHISTWASQEQAILRSGFRHTARSNGGGVRHSLGRGAQQTQHTPKQPSTLSQTRIQGEVRDLDPAPRLHQHAGRDKPEVYRPAGVFRLRKMAHTAAADAVLLACSPAVW
eukprot:TRINITY_DN17280_c0_g1_i1.p1 TRINITY_DN17280_c0_g1~~TRINITY_DN17280_c0_g1_i1.p1  ORF type:complete len:122 (-),score=2.27 TRINITY_DN17280_c0_g1_i1:94-459(-)